mgnify:CR=1 FL=1
MATEPDLNNNATRTEFILNGLTALIGICAILITGILIKREFFSDRTRTISHSDRVEYQVLDNWERLAAEGHGIGPADAPIQIVAFSDFQCPACRSFATSIAALRHSYSDRIRYIFRHFPLANHPHALAAAHAAECAADQGVFERFHDTLFSMQDVIGQVQWVYFAELAAVPDLDGFNACMIAAHSENVERDRNVGIALNLQGTPTVFLNGKRIEGALPYTQLELLVRKELTNLAVDHPDKIHESTTKFSLES